MTEYAHASSPPAPSGAVPAGEPGKLYRVGRLLVVLSMIAVGLGCLFEPWLAGSPGPAMDFFSIHALSGAVLIVAGAAALATKRARPLGYFVGAVALLATIVGGVLPYRDIAAMRDSLDRFALIGALLMLAGVEEGQEGQVGRWFRSGRGIFAASALICIAVEALLSNWLQDGFDMFYFNYDSVTLFNSIWSWSYPLGLVFGLLALIGAGAIFSRDLAWNGAICLAIASILYVPLVLLYRLDDFCGGGRALVELAYEWALDIGLAGGALIVAAVLGQARRGDAAKGPLARVFGVLARLGRSRLAIPFAVVVLVLTVCHGLIPLAFYEANVRGDAKLGDLASRVYAVTYVPARGNSYWRDKLFQGIQNAGPAGRACAAGDPQGCANFASFYHSIGWNWGRAWQLFAKANAISSQREQRP